MWLYKARLRVTEGPCTGLLGPRNPDITPLRAQDLSSDPRLRRTGTHRRWRLCVPQPSDRAEEALAPDLGEPPPAGALRVRHPGGAGEELPLRGQLLPDRDAFHP